MYNDNFYIYKPLYFSMGIQRFMNRRGKALAELLIYSAVISRIITYEIAEVFLRSTYVAKMGTTNLVEYC